MALQRSERPMHAPSQLSAVSSLLPSKQYRLCVVEHRTFLTSEGGMSAISFLNSSFLQAVNAVMLWPVHVQKIPHALEHLCPAKQQISCDICCACQSICLYIPTHSGRPKAVDSHKSLQLKTVHGCVQVKAAPSSLHLLQQVCDREPPTRPVLGLNSWWRPQI